MQYLSADITTFQRVCLTPSKEKNYFDTSSSKFQLQQDSFTNTRGFLSDKCAKVNQSTPDPNLRIASYQNYSDEQEASVQSKQQWPQIKQIVNKICKLEASLAKEKRVNKELIGMLKLYEIKLQENEQERKDYIEQKVKNVQNYQILQEQLKQQQEKLREKEDQISKGKETLSEIQMGLLKRISEIQEKLKKANAENKQLTDRLRRGNMQLEKQRNLHKQLKKEMAARIQQMQSTKENYLIQEIQNLKAIISSSKEEKECRYLQLIATLNHKVYQYEEELKISNIQMSLMERKKQQAVKQVCDKKDQEIKVQKTMFKTLSQKLSKMQEDFRKLTKINSEISRNNRLTAVPKNQEEFLLELSPEKC